MPLSFKVNLFGYVVVGELWVVCRVVSCEGEES